MDLIPPQGAPEEREAARGCPTAWNRAREILRTVDQAFRGPKIGPQLKNCEIRRNPHIEAEGNFLPNKPMITRSNSCRPLAQLALQQRLRIPTDSARLPAMLASAAKPWPPLQQLGAMAAGYAVAGAELPGCERWRVFGRCGRGASILVAAPPI
jgi:hypothetical protein